MILTGLLVAAFASLARGASAEHGDDSHMTSHKYDLLDRCHPFPSASLYL